ncbi:MAG: hypothetical protein DCC52_12020 [Chloroflexi bacterium]|nr:MAG: hypothetical protein DCC52_12020 [Chloroflexota bacterium]
MDAEIMMLAAQFPRMFQVKLYVRLAVGILALSALLAFSACSVPGGGRVIGGQLVQIGEIPTYPGATLLDPGTSQIREPPPFIGLGIEVEKAYRIFQTPRETTFEDVKTFYADKLQAAGWRQDGGMRVLTDQLNATSPNLQGGIWVRVDQTLMLVLATDPQTGDKELMTSLATH